jgi:hypothetical protein
MAAMLSKVITKPIIKALDRYLLRKTGTNALYKGQTILIQKKPKPNKKVFL